MGTNIDQVAEVVGDRIGKDAAYWLNSGKLRNELGWRDRISLEEGIDETIAWIDRYLPALEQLPQSYIHKP